MRCDYAEHVYDDIVYDNDYDKQNCNQQPDDDWTLENGDQIISIQQREPGAPIFAPLISKADRYDIEGFKIVPGMEDDPAFQKRPHQPPKIVVMVFTLTLSPFDIDNYSLYLFTFQLIIFRSMQLE